MKSTLDPCPDCKAQFESFEGPTHEYIGGNAACWKAYGEVLAKEYVDYRYMKYHRWTLDAYAAQHPGKYEPRAAQSVTVHLLALYLMVVRSIDPKIATDLMGKAVNRKKGNFEWLIPPKSLGSTTILDIGSAQSPEEHGERVMKWGKAVWESWSEHHEVIKRLAVEMGIDGR